MKISRVLLLVSLFLFCKVAAADESTSFGGGFQNGQEVPAQMDTSIRFKAADVAASSTPYDNNPTAAADSSAGLFEDYLRVGMGIGFGFSDATSDDENTYGNYGLSLGIRAALEAPILPILSAHVAWDSILLEEPISEDMDFGMSLAAGLSLGQRDVPGNLHLTGSVGYGFVSITEDRDYDSCMWARGCDEQGRVSSGIVNTYRLSVGYTLPEGPMVELVAQRIGELEPEFPDESTASISGLMFTVSTGF